MKAVSITIFCLVILQLAYAQSNPRWCSFNRETYEIGNPMDFPPDAIAFGATEAAFRFIMVAFNLMSIFKQAIMTSEIHHRLSTVKFQCIAIGSYLVKNGRKLKMKLSAEGKRRHFLEHLFDNLEVIRPPYKFSNA